MSTRENGSVVSSIIVLAALSLIRVAIGFTDEESTQKTLDSGGYSEVRTTGWEPFSCGSGDFYSTGFKAKNPKGDRTSGVVCCGIWKSCTIRH